MTFHLPAKLFSVIDFERRDAVLFVLIEAGLHAGDGKRFEFLSNGFHGYRSLGCHGGIGYPMATDFDAIESNSMIELD